MLPPNGYQVCTDQQRLAVSDRTLAGEHVHLVHAVDRRASWF
jgi:hypothetical protein